MKTLDEFFDESGEDIKGVDEEEKEEKKELYGYELPEDWDVVELGKIFREVSKKERKISIEDDREYKLVTVKLYAKGIHLRELKKGENIGTKTMYQVREGDFIFSKIDARNGAYGFVPPELDGAVVSSDFPILNLRKDIASMDYVSYYLSQPIVWESIRNYAVGSTNRKRIKVEDFSKIVKIPLPPLEEQKKIVYVLRTIQRAIEQQDKIIETTKELKKSLMHRLFTKGLDASQPTKQTEIGEVPEHWKITTIGEVCHVGTGGTPSRKNPEYFGGEIPWVKSTEIEYGIIRNTEETLTELGLKNSNAKIYPAGTLLIAMYGQGVTRGRCAILGIDAAINQACAALTPKDNTLDTSYLFYWCQFRYVQIRELGHGSNQPNLNLSLVRSIKVAVPPTLEEQKQIVQILQTVDRKIEIAKKKKEVLQDLFKTMLHKLMTAQIRVKDLEIPPEKFETLSMI